MSRIITKEEIAQHQSKKDLWILVHGQVFDVSRFMGDHPGGWEVLVADNNGVRDLKDDFENIKHTEEARKMSQQFAIGKIAENTPPFPLKMKEEVKGFMVDNKQQGDQSSPLLVGAILIGLGLGAYYVFTKKR